MILALDLGTTTTKAVLWAEDGPVAVGRCPLVTSHPQPGWAEQDPDDWWSSVVAACRALVADLTNVDAVVFSAARSSFVPVSADGRTLGPGILWSDRRAGSEAAALDAAAIRAATGLIVDAGAMVAKTAWMRAHEPERWEASQWLLAPRDLVVARMTGEVLTDVTLASRTGLVDEPKLPRVVASTYVAGGLVATAADALGLRAGTPVVIGAGDRACEVLGTGARADRPMVSWGTTANVSIPVDAAVEASSAPAVAAVSAGALGGSLYECGLSASGEALAWLASLTGLDVPALTAAAENAGVGARGVIALPWLNGARAPWWVSGASAAFTGLTTAHGPGDLARAVYEGVAFDIARSIEALAPDPTAVIAAGGGAQSTLWLEVLGGVLGLPTVLRGSAEAGAAGACLVAAAALDLPWTLDGMNPFVEEVTPDPAEVARYRDLRVEADRVASTVVGLWR